METIAVNTRGTSESDVVTTPDLEQDLARARLLAKWLDARFEVLGVKFGLDAIIGLVPVVGDTLSSALAAYPIWLARRHDLGKVVQAKMAANVAIDWAVGLVPGVGDLFDVAYKANLKNLRLFEAAVDKRQFELLGAKEKPLVE